MYLTDPPDDDPNGEIARDDEEHIDYCLYCAQPCLSLECFPYCCWICAIDAEEDSDERNQ